MQKKDILDNNDDLKSSVASPSLKNNHAAKKEKNKLTFRQITIIFFIIFLCIFTVVINQPRNVTNKETPSAKKSKQTIISAIQPTTVPPVPGTIQWKTTPQQITAREPLSILNQLTYQSDPQSPNPSYAYPQLQYYIVGNWINGPYKGNDIIDVITTESLTYYTGTQTVNYIERVTPVGTKLVYFPNASTEVIDTTKDSEEYLASNDSWQIDNRRLPDLLMNTPPYSANLTSSTNMKPLTITYKGKAESFDIQSDTSNDGINTWDPAMLAHYTLLTTFLNGQKLYAHTQSNIMTYSSIEEDTYPSNSSNYVIEEVDHSLIPIDTSASEDINNASRITWQKSPLIPQGLFGTPPNFWYSTRFQNGCTQILTSQLAGETGFSSDQLEKVGTFEGQQIYIPTNADTLYQALYSYLTPSLPQLTPAIAPVSYDEFVQTYPVIIGKDSFGEYQIFYRLGYPDNLGGCGKPVIYLYPTKKTDVSVHFSPAVTLSKSVPSYTSGWNVVAYPDGVLVNATDQKNYPYLYWEGVTSLSFPTITTGYVIPKNQVLTFLTKQLSEYGLNATEKNDFLSYWVPKMQQNPYYLIHFYTTSDLDQAIPEYISPQPDTVFRILMWFHPLSEPVTIPLQQTPFPFTRNGFTVVEWGGVEN